MLPCCTAGVKPPVCCLPNTPGAWITSRFLNLSLWAICLFTHNLFCVLLYPSLPPFSRPLFAFPQSPGYSLVFVLPLCRLFLSNHCFFHLLPLGLSASLNPSSNLCVFLPFPLASVSFSCLTHILFLPQLECDNFITVMQKVNDTFLVCGTNAGSPRCWMLVRVFSDKILKKGV